MMIKKETAGLLTITSLLRMNPIPTLLVQRPGKIRLKPLKGEPSDDGVDGLECDVSDDKERDGWSIDNNVFT